ncbi:MAG: TatD DNase family protein [Verrucomicrobiales bacterium]|jgi:TatD DNase family protein
MIDVHCHLQDERLSGDVESILETCRAEGIERLIVNGTRPADWPVVAELAERFSDQVRASYGLHPWYVGEVSSGWADALEGYLDGGAIGVGEIGLDKWTRDHDLPKQKEAFVSQLRMAMRRELPVTIHCLRAWGHLLEILQSESVLPQGFLLHSYGGPAEMVDAFVALGGYFSISGYFFHARKQAQLETFLSRVPPNRVLIETDAPDMGLPEGDEAFGDSSANHPANLTVVKARMAALLEVSGESFDDNARRLFRGVN